MTRRDIRRVGVALAICMVAIACNDRQIEHPSPTQEMKRLAERQPSKDEAIVAKVDGRAITQRDATLYWRDHPEMSRDEVIERLIEREVLLGAALQDNADSAETVLARKRGLSRALLAGEVESITEPDWTEEQRERAVEHQRRLLSTPPGYQASHLLVKIPKKKSPEKVWKQAEEVIRAIAEDIEGAPPEVAVLERAREARGGEAQGFEILINRHLKFPEPDAPSAGRPDDWVPVVNDFARATHEVAQSSQEAAFSEPARTQFGWHIILYEDSIAPTHPTEEEALAAASRQALEKRRLTEFAKMVSEFYKTYPVATKSELLDEDELSAQAPESK